MAKPKESGGWGRSTWNYSETSVEDNTTTDKDKDKEEDTGENIEINIDDLHRGLS